MAQGLRRKVEIAFAIGVFGIFGILVINYFLGFHYIVDAYGKYAQIVESKIEYQKSKECDADKSLIDIPGGYLCKKNDTVDLKWESVYDSYPRSNDGAEIVYNFIDEGKIEEADRFLDGYFPVSRFEPFEMKSDITWEEDPYGEKYWRFMFHSLRPTRHLLYAWKETGDEKYRDELIRVIDSYVSVGNDKEVTWSDPHAVAFRSMVLTNVWWKLREQNALDVELSDKIISSLHKHGEFLSNIKNYDPGNNHGVNESAALLLVSLNFPDLSQDGKWEKIAKERIAKSLSRLVDEDGALVENSPYYHFYTMEKFFQINKYALKHDVYIRDDFSEVIKKMAAYGAYILRPDLGVPLTGASMQDKKELSGYLEEIANENSDLMYVLSQGKSGKKPKELNKFFEHSGQTIFRSEWGSGDNFDKATYLFFDVGAYRTPHSDLDALNMTLFGNGEDLIVDSGLYSYEEGEDKKYFKGVLAHNTVMVENSDQFPGTVKAGRLIEGEGYAQQSAFHSLYPGTTHYRNIALFENDLVLVIDRLNSDKIQNYKQLFHISPELNAAKEGVTTIVTKKNGDFAMSVHQVVNDEMSSQIARGGESSVGGWCSEKYEEKVSCETLMYEKNGNSATYITLFKIGKKEKELNFDFNEEEGLLGITFGENDYSITIEAPEHVADVQIKQNKKNLNVEEKVYDLSFNDSLKKWELINEEGEREVEYEVGEKNGKISIDLPEELNYELDVQGIEKYYPIKNKINTDIPINFDEDVKIYEQEDLLPIYGYHHILSDNDIINHPSSQMHMKDFERQMQHSTEVMGCRWFTFAHLMEEYVLKEKKLPKRACVLNFDDGRRNNYENAFPIMEKYDVVASFYVVPQRLESGQYMTWQQVDELYESGSEIGSHTMNSGGLVTAEWNREELAFQINESKKFLENHGYGSVKTFAYPLGEWNDEIVDVVKESGYIAARDISKKNTWRDRRAPTVSMDEEYIWHMSYYKPEQKKVEEINRELGYNGWWQFEEGYAVNSDIDGDVKPRAAVKPTETSYATVVLPDRNDSITNKFVVAKDSEYTIEILATRGVSVSVDNKVQILQKSEGDCIEKNEEEYCFQQFSVNLNEGVHTITSGVNSKNVRVDKFRVFRTIAPKKSYPVIISEYAEKENGKLNAATDNFEQIHANVKRHGNQWSLTGMFLSLGALIIIVFFGYRFVHKKTN